jgi:hypothetical protein
MLDLETISEPEARVTLICMPRLFLQLMFKLEQGNSMYETFLFTLPAVDSTVSKRILNVL